MSASSDDFSGAVLKLIADLPNCTEEKLFIVAVNRDLEGSRDISLGDLKQLLHKCVQQLAACGLVKIEAGEIVTTESGNKHLESPGPIPETDEAKDEAAPPAEPPQARKEEAKPPAEPPQAKQQAEPPQVQADEKDREAAEAPVIAKPADTPRAQDRPKPVQEAPVPVRRTIKDEERALTRSKPAQAQAKEESAKSPGDDAAPIPSEASAPPAIADEEILDLTPELGGLEIVEEIEEIQEDDEPAAEIIELADIASPPDDAGDAEASEAEEILDLTAALGGPDIAEDGDAEDEDTEDEDAKYGDHPVVDLETVRKTPEPVKAEPSPLERAAALFEEEPAPLATPPQSGRFKDTARPQQARSFAQPQATARAEPAGTPSGSGVALTAAGEMTRDIVIASLLVALTAIAAMSGFGGKLSPVLVMLALLLVGSAVWGWRDRRR